MKILGIGNAIVDVLIRLKNDDLLAQYNLPKGGMTLVDKDLAQNILLAAKDTPRSLASGGSAANTIHGIAQLGTPTGFIGKVGYDEMGRFFKSDMEEVGITPYLGSLEDEETGKAVTLITPDSERTFATFLGAAISVSEKDFEGVNFNDYDLVHLEGYLVANNAFIEQSAKKAKEAGCKVSLDLASFTVVESNLEFLKNLTKNYVDIVFANEEEAKAFTGKSPEESLHEIAEMCEIAVVKVGENGSMVKTNGEVTKVGIIKANCVDTTGAGDAYAAGFLYGYANSKTMEQCGKYGALLSGKVIENFGAKIGKETWEEIKTEIENI